MIDGLSAQPDPLVALRRLRTEDPTTADLILAYAGSSTRLAVALGIPGQDRNVRHIYKRFPGPAPSAPRAPAPAVTIPQVEAHQTTDASEEERLPEPTGASENVWRRQAQKLQDEVDRLRQWDAVIADTVERVGLTFKPVPTPPPDNRRQRDEHLLIQNISDVHVGERVSLSDTGGVAEYNQAMFLRRLEALKERMGIMVSDLRSVYPIPHLIWHFLGDIGTSEGVFPMQLARLDMHLEEQIVEAAMHIADLVQWSAAMFPKVTVYAVPGNHCPKDITLNSDRLIYRFMQLLLRRQENVRFCMSDSHYVGYRIGPQDDYVDWGDADPREWAILATHGHQAKRYMSVPYYALDRLVLRYSHMTNRLWDMMFVGHSHEIAQANRWYCNGCWPGGTEYSTERMQGASRPEQLMCLFHPQHGITFQGNVFLDAQPSLTTPDEDGVWTPLVANRWGAAA